MGRDSGSWGVTLSEEFGEGTGSSLKALEDYWVELCCTVRSDDRKYSWKSRVKRNSCIRTLDEVALEVGECQKIPWLCWDNNGGSVGHISCRVG